MKHYCDWCPTVEARYSLEVKKGKNPPRPTGIKWYACKDCRERLEEMEKNVPGGNVVSISD